MTAMENLGSLWNSIQAWLFPMLEDELTDRKFDSSGLVSCGVGTGPGVGG
jgi:hypothetical protein